MTQEHPITPPPELVIEWWNQCTVTSDNLIRQFATQAARWGADQELEACCEWLRRSGHQFAETYAAYLRAARRKPMSTKELAKAEIERLLALTATEGALVTAEPLRLALELLDSLPD